MEYVRDKRSPIPKSEAVSRVMSANKAKNSSPELTLRRALWKAGLRGYRLHYKKVPGRPDISFVGRKFAIFVHGCFWHRCPTCTNSLPKTNSAFWKAKFERNLVRDSRKVQELTRSGWQVLTVWECELKKGLDSVINNIVQRLPAASTSS
jgi:DNA mismatch endonuclease (patch repair protein)